MKAIQWNKVAQRVHQNAVEKGFWEKELSDEHCLMLVITEIAEAVEADRRGIVADVETFRVLEFDDICFESFIKDTVEDELADVVIRLLDLAGARGFDINCVPTQRVYEIGEFAETAYKVVKILTYDGYNSCGKVCESIAAVVSWCKQLNIDLDWHIEQKMKYNTLREPMHRKAY